LEGETMQAVVIRRHGGGDELRFEPDWPKPAAGANEVVVKVRACALNYHDLFTLRGMPGIRIPMPLIMGIDFAGEVDAVGPGVAGWAVGDRVVVDPEDRERFRLVGEMLDGGLAQYCAVPAALPVRLPDEVSFVEAAALPTAYSTAYRMMVTRGNIQAGETVLILGASGGVGTCCVQLAKLAGAHVIVAASSPEKLERLSGIGADHGIDYTAGSFQDEIIARYGKPRVRGPGGGIDVVVNFTGGDTWVRALKVLRKGGRMLTCGATAGFDPKTDIRYIWTFELDIRGSNSWHRQDLLDVLDLVRTRRLKPIVDRVLPLRSAQQAFRALEQRRVFGKIVLDPWPPA
jgi:alcohol dehydrogenase